MKPLVWIVLLGASAFVHAQPATEELRYAVIVTRHGVRSPTWEPARLNRYSAAPWPDWGVSPADLTAHGRTLMEVLGRYYREVFTAQKLLGKAKCDPVYFYADNDQRTLETSRALASSMFPGCTVETHAMPAGKTDPLFDPLEAGFVKQDPQLGLASVTGRVGPDLNAVVGANKPAFDELVRILTGGTKAQASIFDEPVKLTPGEDGVSMSGPLNLASTLSEDFLLEYADGMTGDKLGWGRLNATNLQQILSLHTAYADLMRRTPYVARVRGSNLLSHVLNSMQQAMTRKPIQGALGKPGDALLMISGHDTNLSNLSGMLDLTWQLPTHQRDDAPPGGALIFTLWRSTTNRQYSVRLQFLAQTLDQLHDATPLTVANPPATANLFIPGCSGSTAGYPCSWANFARTASSAIILRNVEK